MEITTTMGCNARKTNEQNLPADYRRLLLQWNSQLNTAIHRVGNSDQYLGRFCITFLSRVSVILTGILRAKLWINAFKYTKPTSQFNIQNKPSVPQCVNYSVEKTSLNKMETSCSYPRTRIHVIRRCPMAVCFTLPQPMGSGLGGYRSWFGLTTIILIPVARNEVM
jgi:hypothetical protein